MQKHRGKIGEQLWDENTVRTAGRDETEKQYGVDAVNKQHGSLGPIGLGANALCSSVAPESILVYSICCSPVVHNNELKCPIKCSLKFNMVSLKRQGKTHSILEGSALNLMKISVCSLNVKNLLSQQC